MKTAETKNTSSPSSSHASRSFFQKKGEGAFFSGSHTDLQTKPFFSKQETTPFIQAKLNVGQPGDKYEEEADTVAEQVVQRMSESNTIQAKLSEREKDDKIQKKGESGKEDEREEKIVQKQSLPEEEDEMLQAQPAEEEEKLQMKSSLQLKNSAHPAGAEVSPNIENKIGNSGGGGRPLDGNSRNFMESQIQSDFSNVSIHTGHEAVQMSQELGARAFTVGRDIYFNKGEYRPETTEGKKLLAHELTHTVQQRGTAQKKIQREDENDAAENNGSNGEEQTEFELQDGTKIKRSGIQPKDNPVDGRRVEVQGLSLPSLKARNSDVFPSKLDLRPYNREQSDTQQGKIWKNSLRSNIEGYVEDLRAEAEVKGGYDQESRTSYLRSVNNPDLFVIGAPENLVKVGLRPFWSKEGKETAFHIDHIVEDQLVNPLDTVGSGFESDSTDNFELLEASANVSSGQNLYHEINRRLRKVSSDYAKEFPEVADEDPLEYGAIRFGNYFVNFENYNFDLSVEEGAFWSYDEIRYGEHLRSQHLEALTGEELKELGLDGDKPKIFLSPTGGEFKEIPPELPAIEWFPRINLKEKHLNEGGESDGGSYLVVDAFKKSESPEDPIAEGYRDMQWPLKRVEGLYAWTVDVNAVRSQFRGAAQSLQLRGLSPIQIDEFRLSSNGIFARGVVLPTFDLIAGAELAIIVDGDDIRMQAEVNSEEISLPSPFSINNANLIFALGLQQGLSVEGGIDFEIERVGEGNITASASTGGGFELEGTFNFDSELFERAEIGVEYKDEIWTIGGEIVISEGKVRGVKSATITVTYSENDLSASGEAELDIPGIERGQMSIEYGEQGFSIGGAFNVSSDVPGIRGGRVEATISKQQAEEDYSVSVDGTAQPDIPGVDTTLAVSYVDGVINIEGSAAYSRGMLSGTVQLGATNREINEDGTPQGEPDNDIRVYGGGSLTLQLTPWLEATAGVRFLENGELEVQGRIGLPDTVDVFPRKEIRRNLFTAPTIEIPLFAIPLGPRSIGLVAQIGGGLDFAAGFGPGQLRELSAEVIYNPDREEETTVHGRGVFAIPADAGLTLRGDMGLGVSVGIASLTGGIELTGTLGLEGEATAGVDVNWSPQTGIALDAEGRVMVNPKFAFDVNAFARASLGVGFLSVTETWRHNLAGFEWGPDIQFGVIFPVNYREGEPFDMSFDDIQVVYPELDIPTMAKGLAQDIKGDFID